MESVLKEWFSKIQDNLGPGSHTYSILKPCFRCVYGKRYEPILVFSRNRGPRIIVNLDGKTYLRKGECLGFKECGLCFDVIGKEQELGKPCQWIRL